MTTKPAPGPPQHKMAVLTWIAIYPTITIALWLLQPLGLHRLPLALQTFVLTAVLVPIMVFVLVPALTRALTHWLHKPRHCNEPRVRCQSSTPVNHGLPERPFGYPE